MSGDQQPSSEKVQKSPIHVRGKMELARIALKLYSDGQMEALPEGQIWVLVVEFVEDGDVDFNLRKVAVQSLQPVTTMSVDEIQRKLAAMKGQGFFGLALDGNDEYGDFMELRGAHLSPMASA